MKDVKLLQQERNKIYKDFYNNIVPERMPISFSLRPTMLAEIAGIDIVDVQFDYSKLGSAIDTASSLFYTDTCPLGTVGGTSRIPGYYQYLESQTFQMSSGGFMQHPDTSGMNDDEYKELIDDPYAFIMEKVLPRQHRALSMDDPVKRAMRVSMIKSEEARQKALSGAVVKKLVESEGYYNGAPAGGGGMTAAPFDFIADQLRGFSGTCTDIRRHRDELKLACERLLPLMFNLGMPSNPNPEGVIGTPLHMPTYMRQKDFEELWLPTYMKLLQQYAARGVRLRPFFEENWMKYIDIIADFPSSTLMLFEQADAKLVKEKLGDKFFITGIFPLEHARINTKEQVIDEAKELLDIMLPGCGYLFNFNKGTLNMNDVNLDTWKALSEFLYDYARYDHVGEKFGKPLNSEDYAIDSSIGIFESKYLTKWSEYKEMYPMTPDFVKNHIEEDDIKELKFYLTLLL